MCVYILVDLDIEFAGECFGNVCFINTLRRLFCSPERNAWQERMEEKKGSRREREWEKINKQS